MAALHWNYDTKELQVYNYKYEKITGDQKSHRYDKIHLNQWRFSLLCRHTYTSRYLSRSCLCRVAHPPLKPRVAAHSKSGNMNFITHIFFAHTPIRI
jgi:hypothetical protein